jgi:hypothetical protein
MLDTAAVETRFIASRCRAERRIVIQQESLVFQKNKEMPTE